MEQLIQKRGFRFSSNEKIRLKREIKEVMLKGERCAGDDLTLVWLKRPLPGQPEGKRTNRFAIRMERRFPSAAIRNRVRRWVREIVRQEKWNIRPNVDLLIFVKPFIVSQRLDYWALKGRFKFLCQKAGVWSTE